MPLILPSRPDLARLRRMAKDLLASTRRGETTELRRLAVLFPTVTPATAKLAQAQTVLARDYGFPSWTELVAAVTLRAARLKARGRADRGEDRRRG